jgi:hypothetical protein
VGLRHARSRESWSRPTSIGVRSMAACRWIRRVRLKELEQENSNPERHAESEIRNSTPRSLSPGPPGYFAEGGRVGIRGNEQARRLARCPTVGTLSIAAPQVNVNTPTVGRHQRSNLSAASDCNSVRCYDSHDLKSHSGMTKASSPRLFESLQEISFHFIGFQRLKIDVTVDDRKSDLP